VLGDGWVPVDVAAAVAGVPDGAAANALLVEEGLARTRGGTVFTQTRVSHAVLRAAVHDVLGEERRRALHRAAVAHLDDPGLRLRHRVLAGDEPGSPVLAADVRRYAAEQHANGHFRDAARTLRLAARVAAPGDERRAVEREAEMEALLGRAPEAVRLRLADGDARDRLVVAMSLAVQGEWQQAWTVLAPVAPAEVDALPSALGYRLLAVRAWVGAGCGRPAQDVLAAVEAAAAHEPDPAAVGLLEFGRYQALTQTLDEPALWHATGHGADRSTLASTPAGAGSLAWRGIVYALNGMLPDAVADLTLAAGLLGDGALDLSDGVVYSVLAVAHLAAGEMPRALMSLDVARTAAMGSRHPMILAARRLSVLVGEDAERSGADVAAARAALMRNRFVGGIYLADIVDVLVLALTGSADEQRAWARRRWSELGSPEPLRRVPTPALWAACLGLAEAWRGRPEDAEEWARDLESRRVAPPWRDAMVRWLRARAAAAAGTDGTATLAALAAVGFEDVPVLRAVVAHDAAESARARRCPDAADLQDRAAALRRTFTYLRGGDGARAASDDAPSPGTALVGTGLAGTAPDGTAPDGTASPGAPEPDDVFALLSERERAAAALVVDGMSYAQIARELFVTRSTVGFHLSNCYAKTNTSSRHELAQRIRETRRVARTA
jgi:DNA-binding CsgD family transcriptional regulator